MDNHIRGSVGQGSLAVSADSRWRCCVLGVRGEQMNVISLPCCGDVKLLLTGIKDANHRGYCLEV